MRGDEGKIANMLREQKRHRSFHTPGHKKAGADITELSYSDNLLSPHGVIAAAQKDVAEILGAERSFLLTDGSTCGVHAMIYALKAAGVRSVAYSAFSHKSVKEGCQIAGLTPVEIAGRTQAAIPMQPTEEELALALAGADALLLTSPDYYGNFPPLQEARRLCERMNKPLLIDGAHGAHLHFVSDYAGRYADMWTDGVHKSLPALTQGAVVSARNSLWGERLSLSVNLFRTTSPSYPIMASVENAVKYPRNEKIERLAQWAKNETNAVCNGDWTKIVIPFGDFSDEAQKILEEKSIFCEFNDGNYLMFYLSPCTKAGDLKALVRAVKKLPRGEIRREETTPVRTIGKSTKWVALGEAAGKICAADCGLFPPCVPLILRGERVTEEAAARLETAANTFGLRNGQIRVFDDGEGL